MTEKTPLLEAIFAAYPIPTRTPDESRAWLLAEFDRALKSIPRPSLTEKEREILEKHRPYLFGKKSGE